MFCSKSKSIDLDDNMTVPLSRQHRSRERGGGGERAITSDGHGDSMPDWEQLGSDMLLPASETGLSGLVRSTVDEMLRIDMLRIDGLRCTCSEGLLTCCRCHSSGPTTDQSARRTGQTKLHRSSHYSLRVGPTCRMYFDTSAMWHDRNSAIACTNVHANVKTCADACACAYIDAQVVRLRKVLVRKIRVHEVAHLHV